MSQAHKRLVLLILVGAVLAAVPASLPASGAGEPPPEALIDGNNAFATNLYCELKKKEGNIFFSPYSVSSALGMTYAGARQNTAAEMKETLHFELDQARLHSSFKRLSDELRANACRSDQKLRIANGLCLTGGSVTNDFSALLKENYDAEVFSGVLCVVDALLLLFVAQV